MEKKAGGCLCGGVRYETWGKPIDTSVCHCPWCKKLSGAVYASQIVVHKDNYKITKGDPKYFSLEHLGQSYGNWFCQTCGSTVGRDASPFPDIRVVKLGTLDNLEDINWAKPKREIYTEARVSWVPQFENCVQIPQLASEVGLDEEKEKMK
ncbi:Glutathione-dependent formaldehyde-activating enzyme [Penicillium lividum]|nr:Glutathione-dependent formaldehyde-activating enzyme [Penicillium lividum]